MTNDEHNRISVLKSFEKRLIAFVWRILGNLEKARDVVQDTYLALMRENWDEIRPRVAPWLFTVARRKALDVLRKDKNMTYTATPESHATVAESERTQLQLVETDQNTRQMNLALKELPANQQEVLRLRFQNDLSYQEIADVMELSLSHVGVLIHKALQTLRSDLSRLDAAERSLS